MNAKTSQLSKELAELGLEQYALELETNGLTIVPQEVTGVTDDFFEHCTNTLLNRFTEITGCPISLENGPEAKLTWPSQGSSILQPKGVEPTQYLIQQLLQLDRCFRDLFVNPVVDALIDHLFGRDTGVYPGAEGSYSRKNRRLSSTNSFVKWQGEHGYGKELGLHCDQGANPLPWGHAALTANATWCLTEYTKSDGALAYVPGSHKSNAHPMPPHAKAQAVAAECPKGSVIIWPGSTWHGAYPKLTPGLRLNAVAYYRHHSVLPQENLKITMKNEPWNDCCDAEMIKELIGFEDTFPYTETSTNPPRVAE